MTELRRGPVNIERNIELPQLEERLAHCEYDVSPESARAKIHLEPCGNGVLVRGTIETRLHTQCGTCLANMTLLCVPEVSAYLLPRPETEEELDDVELTPEDLEKEWFDGETVILDELLFDALMLDLPMNPRCGETCPGIPAGESCSGNPADTSQSEEKEIDPRLAPLASLRLEKER